MAPEINVPDLMQAVEGWRAWGVPQGLPPFGLAPKLYSVTNYGRGGHHPEGGGYAWKAREAAEATCPVREDHNGRCPVESCTCGFYTALSLEHLMTMAYHRYDADAHGMFRVIGQVANWGKVIEGTLGWRSQYAYPTQLFVPFEAWRLAKPLSEAYGVPVRLQNILNITTAEEA